MLTLVILEHRQQVWPVVQEVFSNEVGVELSNEKPSEFVLRKDIDALVERGWFAHERYGGSPMVGVAQVISTKGDPYAPPWVVTKPSFPAHMELANSEDRIRIVRDDARLAPADEASIVFAKVFDTVERFNETSATPKIQRLGCDLEFLGIPILGREEAMRREIEGIRQAYRAHRSLLSDN